MQGILDFFVVEKRLFAGRPRTNQADRGRGSESLRGYRGHHSSVPEASGSEARSCGPDRLCISDDHNRAMSSLLDRSIQGAVLAGWVAGLLWWEHKRSLRRVAVSKLKRDVRNLAVAGLAAAATLLLEAPVAIAIARRAQQQRTGLLQDFSVPDWVKPFAAVLLLDYTLYIWHILTHRVPFLWRFHRVHHIDREMDASTALRFHFGEITISVAFRAAQIWLIGPTPTMYAAWQTFLVFCILFHHANVRLPIAWERRLARVLVTPR